MRRSKRRFMNHLILLTFLAALSILAVGGRKSLQHYLHLKDVHRQLLEENMTLVNDNKRLRNEKENLYTPDYLEKLSRESLGLVKADEVIYVVEDAKTSPGAADRSHIP